MKGKKETKEKESYELNDERGEKREFW